MIGALSSWQGHLNGELARDLDDARQAALVSMTISLLIASVLLAVRPTMRAGLTRGLRAYRGGSLVWWQLLGGLGGATLLAAQSVVVPLVGVALFTVAVIAAQTAASLAVDRAGLGPAGPQPLTSRRVLAAAIAVAAVVVSVFGKHGSFALAPLLLAALAGVAVAVQYALNGRVGVATADPMVAAWGNFVVGFLALVVVFSIGAGVTGHPPGALPNRWWLYLSGPIGVVFVAVAAHVVRVLGVLLFSLSVVCGQVVGAVVIDVVSPTGGAGVGAATLAGVAMTVLSVGVGSGVIGRRVQGSPT